MSLQTPTRLAVRWHLRRTAPTSSRRARRQATRRPIVEWLEEHACSPCSGSRSWPPSRTSPRVPRTSISYTQVGNNDNPFQYSAIPLSLKMPDGSVDAITNQKNKTAAKTTLNIDLDNYGYFVSAGTSPDFSINGHVVVGANTYDGSLLTAQAQEFGFGDTITKADAEFDVRLTITGGLLTQSGGPFNVGDSLAS